MRNEPEFRDRVQTAALRILTTKLRYLRGKNAVPAIPDLNQLRARIPDKDGTIFYQNLAARSVTIVHAKTDALPLPPAKAGRVLLAGLNSDFFVVGRNAYEGAPRIWYSANELALLAEMAQSADTIIFYLDSEEGLAVLRTLRPLGKRVIVVSVFNPAYLKSLDWVDCAIAVYSDSKESLIAGFSVITGKLKAQGALPFSF